MSIHGAYDVDLRSLIDVLGTNLYSNPGVYVRELLQNAIDAHTVAGASDLPIEIDARGDRVRITDRGVGMTPEAISELLGTIGRSSKRDDLGFSDGATIGQFGVGLLSAFLVADEVEVESLAAGSEPVRWVGSMAGGFEVTEGSMGARGTVITLRARRGAEKWLSESTVRRLAAEYVGFHPGVFIFNDRLMAAPADPITPGPNSGDLAARRIAFCQDEFGFTPLESFEVAVPSAGLRGVAYVRPRAADVINRAGHRCYVKGLLVGDVADLLPDWAYFVRVVVDATGLSLTASREGLVHDELFAEVRAELGAQVLGWLIGLGDHAQTRERFLTVHEMGVKAIASSAPDLLRFVDRHCLFETNFGPMSLSGFRARFTTMRYATSVDDFRVLADILANRGIGIINAGHAYETGVIHEVVRSEPEFRCEAIGQEYLLAEIGVGSAEVAERFAGLCEAARVALLRFGCRVELGAIDPESVSALLITDDSAQLSNDRATMLAHVEGEADAWLSALGSLAEDEDPVDTRPALVLNTNNPLIKRLNDIDDELVRGAVLRTVYGQAAIRTRRPVRGVVATEVDEALGVLAEMATRSAQS